MQNVQSSRGPFIVCETCYAILLQDRLVDDKGRALVDDISSEFCPNCFDRNKILIDDLAGSSE
jgi:hypothetical protein